MPNSIENIVYFLGILSIGGIEVNLSPEMKDPHILYAFQETEISALVCQNVSPERVKRICEHAPNSRLIITDRKLKAELDYEPIMTFEDIENVRFDNGHPVPPCSPAEIAIIQYTSGSTGTPKGAALSQQNFIAASQRRNALLHFTEQSCILNILGLSHSCSKSLAIDACVTGASLVLGNGFLPPVRFLKLLRQEKPTIVTGPPLLFHYLLKLRRKTDVIESLKSHLKYLEIGLSYIPTNLFRELRQVFPWITLINRYGTTENAGAASLRCYDPDDDLTTAGVLGNVEDNSCIEVRNLRATPESSEKIGDITIKGDSVMIGYWKDIQRNRDMNYVQNGFFTGDIGRVDEHGLIYSLGRNDDLVKVSGERVALVEVEEILLHIDGIDEAAVFALPDDTLGERVVAVFYGSPELQEEQILHQCQQQLPGYMIPHTFIKHTAALPKTPSGKIAKYEIKNQYSTLT